MSDKTPFIGVVTVSDRASQGIYEDLSGPAIIDYLTEHLDENWKALKRIVPDQQDIIETTLLSLCDEEHCALVITTGGTGPAPRDVTPNATINVCDKLLPGFGELMRRISYEKVPTAILSRQVAGTRGQTVIVNLPGSPKAIRECLDAVFPAVPHCISLIGGPNLTLSGSGTPASHT